MAKLQITVDDGPQPSTGALDIILDELADRKVRAAFFNIGKEIHAEPRAVAAINSRGHVLGNHSWNHLKPSAEAYSDSAIVQQFTKTHDEVEKISGVTMRHWRAPRLDFIPRLSSLLVGPGKLYTLSHCDSNADSKDSGGAIRAGSMLTSIREDIAKQSARSNFRLLFHVKATTANSLRAVLDGLLTDGHQIIDFEQSS